MNMSKLKEFVKSPHIKIALATGFCIVLTAYVSKKVLSEPMKDVELGIVPFIALIYELLLGKNKNSKYLKPEYWITAIFITTLLLIVFHLI